MASRAPAATERVAELLSTQPATAADLARRAELGNSTVTKALAALETAGPRATHPRRATGRPTLTRPMEQRRHGARREAQPQCRSQEARRHGAARPRRASRHGAGLPQRPQGRRISCPPRLAKQLGRSAGC